VSMAVMWLLLWVPFTDSYQRVTNGGSHLFSTLPLPFAPVAQRIPISASSLVGSCRMQHRKWRNLRMSTVADGFDVNALPDCKRRVVEVAQKVASNLGNDVLNLASLRQSVRDMEQESSQPEFWEDQAKAQEVLAELNRVKILIARVEAWKSGCEDVEMILELANDSTPEETSKYLLSKVFTHFTRHVYSCVCVSGYGHPLLDAFLAEALAILDKIEADLGDFEIERLLSGKFDKYGCTLCIQSGAGGTEAQDWAGMLLRMYKRFAERRGFKITTVEEATADFGIKSVELKIEGPFAYGFLSGEKGTHRLVRISPFNAQGKRQTSFAGVETWPILENKEIEDIQIPEKVIYAVKFDPCVVMVMVI
jgi:peptide chain release factor 2